MLVWNVHGNPMGMTAVYLQCYVMISCPMIYALRII
jgi:hypothetical protein